MKDKDLKAAWHIYLVVEGDRSVARIVVVRMWLQAEVESIISRFEFTRLNP